VEEILQRARLARQQDLERLGFQHDLEWYCHREVARLPTEVFAQLFVQAGLLPGFCDIRLSSGKTVRAAFMTDLLVNTLLDTEGP